MMTRWIKVILGLVLLALIIAGCGSEKPNEPPPATGIVIKAEIYPDHLEFYTFGEVIMQAVFGDSAVNVTAGRNDDGYFVFPPIEFPAGSTTFTLWSGWWNDDTLYVGDTLIDIEENSNQEIHIKLLPKPPMIVLTPLHAAVEICDQIACSLQVFNIPTLEFIMLRAHYWFDNIQLVDSAIAADARWGQLTITSQQRYDDIQITCTRDPGEFGTLPRDVYSLLTFNITPIRARDIRFFLYIDSISFEAEETANINSYFIQGPRLNVSGDNPQAAIYGTITNAETGAPIPDVNVVYGDPGYDESKTDENGQYSFSNAFLGSTPISAFSAEYSYQRKWVTVTCNEPSKQVDFEMTPWP